MLHGYCTRGPDMALWKGSTRRQSGLHSTELCFLNLVPEVRILPGPP